MANERLAASSLSPESQRRLLMVQDLLTGTGKQTTSASTELATPCDASSPRSPSTMSTEGRLRSSWSARTMSPSVSPPHGLSTPRTGPPTPRASTESHVRKARATERRITSMLEVRSGGAAPASFIEAGAHLWLAEELRAAASMLSDGHADPRVAVERLLALADSLQIEAGSVREWERSGSGWRECSSHERVASAVRSSSALRRASKLRKTVRAILEYAHALSHGSTRGWVTVFGDGSLAACQQMIVRYPQHAVTQSPCHSVTLSPLCSPSTYHRHRPCTGSEPARARRQRDGNREGDSSTVAMWRARPRARSTRDAADIATSLRQVSRDAADTPPGAREISTR